MRGISPVIAAGLLVLVTVVSAAAFFAYFSRLTSTAAEKSERTIIYPENPPQIVGMVCYPGYAKLTLMDTTGEGVNGTIRYMVRGERTVTGTREVNITHYGEVYIPAPAAPGDTLSVRLYTPYWELVDSCTVQRDDSMVLWLRFDEGSGTSVRDSSGYGNDGALHFDSVTVWDTQGNTQYTTTDPEGSGWVKVTSTSHTFTGDMVFENGALRVIVSKITTTTVPYYVWDGSSWVKYNAHYFTTRINSVDYINPGWAASLLQVSNTRARAKIQSAGNAWFEVILDAEVPYVKIVVHPNGDTVNYVGEYIYLRNRFEIVSTSDVLDELMDRYFVGTYRGVTDNIGPKHFSGSNVVVNFGPYMGSRSHILGGYDTFLKVVGIDQADSSSFVDSRYWNRVYLNSPSDGRYWFIGGYPINTSVDFIYIEAENCSVAGDFNISKVARNNEVVGTGDGSTTLFRLDYAHVKENSEKVYVGGVLQTRNVDYTINYETGEITFSSPPASGSQITASYVYYDAYPNGGSIYFVPSSTPTKVLFFKPNVTGTYRIFIHAKSLKTNTAQFRAAGGLQGAGSWISNSAPDTYYETLNLGEFYLRPTDSISIYVKDDVNSNPVMIDYVLLVRIPSSADPNGVFSHYNSEYANRETFDQWKNGRWEKSFSFDGLDDYVNVEGSKSLATYADGVTLSLWFNSNFLGSDFYGNQLVSHQYTCSAGSINGFEIATRSGGSLVLVSGAKGTNPGDWVINAGISTGRWYHLGFVWESTGPTTSRQSFYINGTLFASRDISIPIPEIPSSTDFIIGYFSTCWPKRYFNGTMDELRIYNRALSEEEIKAIYEAYSS